MSELSATNSVNLDFYEIRKEFVIEHDDKSKVAYEENGKIFE